MQNENKSTVASPKNFFGLVTTGMLLLAVGVLFFREVTLPASERSWIGQRFDSLIFGGPLLVVLGAAMLLTGAFRGVRNVTEVDSMMTPRRASGLGKVWRIIVWVATAMTIYPWWWLGLWTRLNGGRPGNEGEGMAGALIMMFCGFPSLAVAVFNEVRVFRNQHRTDRGAPGLRRQGDAAEG